MLAASVCRSRAQRTDHQDRLRDRAHAAAGRNQVDRGIKFKLARDT